jgi:hypothetical protein
VVFIQKSTFIFGLIKALVGWPELFHLKIVL